MLTCCCGCAGPLTGLAPAAAAAPGGNTAGADQEREEAAWHAGGPVADDVIVDVIPLFVQGNVSAAPTPAKQPQQTQSPPVPRRPKPQAQIAAGAQDPRHAQMAHAQVAQEDMDVSTPASRPRNVGDDVVHVVHGLQITEVRTS